MKLFLAFFLPLALAAPGCTEGDGDGDDDDIAADGDADADADEPVDLEDLPCRAHVDRELSEVWELAFAYTPEGRLWIQRVETDSPADGIMDDARLEVHEYGDHGTDRVSHDAGADCTVEYSFLYDHRGRGIDQSRELNFDERGNVLRATAAGGEECVYEYDDHDNLVSSDCLSEFRNEYGGPSEWMNIATTYTWSYDAAGHEVALDTFSAQGENTQFSFHWRWTWDDGGHRVREESWQDNRGTSGEVVDWTYDGDGRLLTEVRDNESVDSETTFFYDCWDQGGPDVEAVACSPSRVSTEPFVSFALGAGGGYATRADGTIAHWGAVPLVEGSFASLSAPGAVTCGLREIPGAIECVAASPAYEVDAHAPDGAFVAVEVGTSLEHCGIREGGSLACWGAFDGAFEPIDPPEGAFTTVSIGNFSACALDADGHATCWGRDVGGEAEPPPGASFRQIDVADWYACGITMGGELTCWGQAPPHEAGAYRSVGVGSALCAVRADGTLTCSGSLIGVPPEGRFSTLQVADKGACALREDGYLVCWGDNEYGQTTPP